MGRWGTLSVGYHYGVTAIPQSVPSFLPDYLSADSESRRQKKCQQQITNNTNLFFVKAIKVESQKGENYLNSSGHGPMKLSASKVFLDVFFTIFFVGAGK